MSPARTQTGAGLLSAEAVALAAGASAPTTPERAPSLLRTGPDPFDFSDVPLAVAPTPWPGASENADTSRLLLPRYESGLYGLAIDRSGGMIARVFDRGSTPHMGIGIGSFDTSGGAAMLGRR